MLFLWFLATGMPMVKATGQCQVPLRKAVEAERSYRVGVLAIRGVESAYNDYNATFSEYLTKVAGSTFDPPISFEMVAVPFGDGENDPLNLFASDDYDFLYANPSMFSCIQSEMGASSLVSKISKRNVNGQVYNLTKFGGVIFTRANNSQVNTIADVRGQRVGAVSLSGLGR